MLPLLVALLLYTSLQEVEARCQRTIPNGRTIDDCRSEDECRRNGWGTMCCQYCGAEGCNNYCRGTGTNGDDSIGGGNGSTFNGRRRRRSADPGVEEYLQLLGEVHGHREKRQWQALVAAGLGAIGPALSGGADVYKAARGDGPTPARGDGPTPFGNGYRGETQFGPGRPNTHDD